MRYITRSWLPSALAIVMAPAVAQAQDLEPPRHRQGYYVSVGGYSALNYNREKGDGLGVWSGGAGSLRLGQLITRRLGLGLAIESGGTSGKGQNASLFGLGVEGHVAIVDNLALQAGAGIGVVSLSDPSEKDAELRGTFGTWWALGIGYDWFPFKSRQTGGFSVRPTVQLRFVPGETVDSGVAFLGVELGYWTGLPRNQLDLPAGEAWKKGP